MLTVPPPPPAPHPQQVLGNVRWPPDPWSVMSGEYPSKRASPLGLASTTHVSSPALAAHPTRPLFLSGSSSGHVYMWQYGSSESCAAYMPALASSRGAGGRTLSPVQAHEAVTAPHWGEPVKMMFSRNGYRFGAVGEGGVVALWRSDMIDSVSVLRELWASVVLVMQW